MKWTKVGYGATVLISPDDKVYIYDAGRLRVGRDALYDFLVGYLGVRHIHGAFISHFHFNHFHGLPYLIERLDGACDAVYSSGVYSTGNEEEGAYSTDLVAQEKLDEVLDEYNIPHNNLVAGDTVDLGGGAVANVLNPPSEIVYEDKTTDHPNGPDNLTVKFENDDFSLLHTGDQDNDSIVDQIIDEEDNYSADTDISANIFVLTHHGDPDRVNEEIQNAIDPDLIVVGMHRLGESAHDALVDADWDSYWIGKRTRMYGGEGRTEFRGRTDGSYNTKSVPEIWQTSLGRGSAL